MTISENGTVYYYVTNLQGDVVAILDSSGSPVVQYTYDAWGKQLGISGTMASTLGTYNPLRYRGYVYDQETGLYYVSSRYYDPEIGRWINADSVIANVGGTIQGYNLFAYCFNNPADFSDSSGNWPACVRVTDACVNKSVIESVKNVIGNFIEDFLNYDPNNQSEEKAINSHYFSAYKGVPVIRINGDRSGYFGAIFLTRETENRDNAADVVRHEYGHSKQMKQLGIVKYTLCVGIPSWREWGTGEYYSKPWEILADFYGDVQSRNHSQININRGFEYLEWSKRIGALVWFFIE